MVATESAPVRQQKQRARRVHWGRIEVPWALIVLVISVLLWQFVVVAFHVKEYLVPTPLKVAQELIDNWGMYWHNTLATGAEVLVGFGISLAIALPIALLIAYSRPLSRAIYPLLVVSQTVPKIALAPLFLVWFGFGWTPKVLITVLVAFFPIVVDSVNGFTSAPPEMRDLTRSMGAKRLPNFWKVQLPQALPQIFAGMKIASTLAVIGAVVAEFIGANNGLGYIITLAVNNLQTVEQFAAIVLLSVMGMLFFGALALLERLLLPWHVSVRSRQP